ncbi:hypothetical protein HPB50_006217 [Hyalomma asiaticum]|uniref:Uncharacterized protein n=1 Tax=Hyalomma asiaticum TaxID=266040 RepID=A0ACB7RLX7_HYAAI|nr:hypothetical protein HPB50_006217 [Hyalomma asiaticum]
MTEEGAIQLDSEVKKMFLAGLPLSKTRCPDCLIKGYMKHGVDLQYTQKISEADASVLRRLLLTGPPVEDLILLKISRRAFKVAFDDLDECPSLNYVYFHIDCEGEALGTNLSAAFRNLRTMELRCDNVGREFAVEIANYIRQSKSLRTLVLWNSCGGDEGAITLIHALAANDTLKSFSLADMKLSSNIVIGFAEMLAYNTTLESVDLSLSCSPDKDMVCWLLAQGRYPNVFKRICVVWPEQLLPELTFLVRRQACYPTLAVQVGSSVNEHVLWEFFVAVAADTTVRRLILEVPEHRPETFDALAEGIAFLVTRTMTLREMVIDIDIKPGKVHHVVRILDALRWNRSIKTIIMRAESMTQELATSFAQLLSVNSTLSAIHYGNLPDIHISHAETILRALTTNYTLTTLEVTSDPELLHAMGAMEALLERNKELERKAARFVASGADVSDREGLDALNKLRSSPGLVERLHRITGETEEVAFEAILSTLAHLSLGSYL